MDTSRLPSIQDSAIVAGRSQCSETPPYLERGFFPGLGSHHEGILLLAFVTIQERTMGIPGRLDELALEGRALHLVIRHLQQRMMLLRRIINRTNFPYSRLMDGPDREKTRGFPRFSEPIPGPSSFRSRNYSIKANHSNIMRRVQTSLRRNEARRVANREQPLPPVIDP